MGWNLQWLLPYNSDVSAADCLDARGTAFVAEKVSAVPRRLGLSSIDEAVAFIDRLLHEAGCGGTLADQGLTADDVPVVMEEATSSARLGNNPRAVDLTLVQDLLEQSAATSRRPDRRIG